MPDWPTNRDLGSAQTANWLRSLPAIHRGALPRPVQVSPLLGSAYFGAILRVVLTACMPLFVPSRSFGVSPYSAINVRTLLIASRFEIKSVSVDI